MWWKVLLQAAIALGLDKWAERKAADLIRKGIEKLTKKADKLSEAVPQSETVKALAANVAAAQAAAK